MRFMQKNFQKLKPWIILDTFNNMLKVYFFTSEVYEFHEQIVRYRLLNIYTDGIQS